MKLSFVIPAYNEKNYIGNCLKSIFEATKDKFTDFEIIVINNASTDKTREVAAAFSGVKVVDEPDKSLTKARQKGLTEAKGEWLAYIDADTKLSENWLELLLQAIEKNKKMVCYSGPYRYYDAAKYREFILNLLWKISAPITYRLVGYMVLGGNFVAKKQALLAMGGFDTSIEFYGEDTNLARRLSKFGDVIFDMKFFIYSSSRRFKDQGLIKLSAIYAINFISEVVFHRPATKTYII